MRSLRSSICIGLVLAGCAGCAPLVKELKKPPFPYAATHHTRVVGIQASYNGYGLRFGFCSDVLTLIPCATNTISMPPFSDRFKVGQSGFDTTIVEEITTGWENQPPPPMMKTLQSGEVEHKLGYPDQMHFGNAPSHAVASDGKLKMAYRRYLRGGPQTNIVIQAPIERPPPLPVYPP